MPHCCALTTLWPPDVVAAFHGMQEASGIFTVAASIAKTHKSKVEATTSPIPEELNAGVLGGMADLCLAQVRAAAALPFRGQS